jgi:hypothetical protein
MKSVTTGSLIRAQSTPAKGKVPMSALLTSGASADVETSAPATIMRACVSSISPPVLGVDLDGKPSATVPGKSV